MSLFGLSKTGPRCDVCVFAGRVFNGSGKPIDRGPAVLAEDFLDIMGQFLLLQLCFHKCSWLTTIIRTNAQTLSVIIPQSSFLWVGPFFMVQVSQSTPSVASTQRR